MSEVIAEPPGSKVVIFPRMRWTLTEYLRSPIIEVDPALGVNIITARLSAAKRPPGLMS